MIRSPVWLIVMIYAVIGWVICFALPWIYITGPVTWVPIYIIAVAKERRKIAQEASRKQVIFQARKLAKTFREERFGRVELEAFLGTVHIAMSLGTSPEDVEKWLVIGFGQADNSTLATTGNLTLSYPFISGQIASLPQLLLNGKEVQIR